jgi:prefoldin subunit 5
MGSHENMMNELNDLLQKAIGLNDRLGELLLKIDELNAIIKSQNETIKRLESKRDQHHPET